MLCRIYTLQVTKWEPCKHIYTFTVPLLSSESGPAAFWNGDLKLVVSTFKAKKWSYYVFLQDWKKCFSTPLKLYYLSIFKHLIASFLCVIRKRLCKKENGVYLLFFFYLTEVHVQALCKQIVSDAATSTLLLMLLPSSPCALFLYAKWVLWHKVYSGVLKPFSCHFCCLRYRNELDLGGFFK